jgi:hypothetical protein
VQNLDSSHKADLYEGGLQDHILVDVELRDPRDLPTAVYLARLFQLYAHNYCRRRHTSAASRALCRRQGCPCHHRCHQQPALPSQVHSSRQRSSRSASFAASRRRNSWSGFVRGYAITMMSPSFAVTSASACSTSTWATT